MSKDQPMTAGIWALGIPTSMCCSLFTSRRKRHEVPNILCLCLKFAKLAVFVLNESSSIYILFVQYRVLKGDIGRQAL